jgi:hypothetical protein
LAWRRDRQLQQPGGIGEEDRIALSFGDVEVLDQLDSARFERGQWRRIAAIDDAPGPDPVEHHLHCRQIESDGVEVHFLEIVARRVLDLHGGVRAEEERLLLQFVGVVHPADGLADTAAAVRGHDCRTREVFQDAAHDQPRERQA